MDSKNKKYQHIHYWLRYYHKTPSKCSKCNGSSNRIEWALIKGKSHAKAIDNYIPLCVKCHREYDLTGRKLTAEHKNNISMAKKGKSIGVGKILTEQHKNNISKSMPKKIKKSDMPRIIMMYSSGCSLSRIASEYNTTHTTISKYIKKEIENL